MGFESNDIKFLPFTDSFETRECFLCSLRSPGIQSHQPAHRKTWSPKPSRKRSLKFSSRSVLGGAEWRDFAELLKGRVKYLFKKISSKTERSGGGGGESKLILQQEVGPRDRLGKMKCGGLAFLEIQFSGFEKV